MAIWPMALVVLAASSVLAGTAADVPQPEADADTLHYVVGGDTLLVRLPFEFEVPEQNRLYLLGERVRSVRFTLVPGDTLFLNGLALMPRFRCKPYVVEITDEQNMRTYRDAPYFQQLLSSGMTPKQAGTAYCDATQRLRTSLNSVYLESLASGLDRTASCLTARDALPDLDTLGLVDREQDVVATWNELSLRWAGMPCGEAIQFGNWDAQDTEPTMPSDARKAQEVRTLHRVLTSSGPVWYIVSCGSDMQFGGADATWRAARQLELAGTTGEATEGILAPVVIAEIVGWKTPTLLYGRRRVAPSGGALAN